MKPFFLNRNSLQRSDINQTSIITRVTLLLRCGVAKRIRYMDGKGVEFCSDLV